MQALTEQLSLTAQVQPNLRPDTQHLHTKWPNLLPG